MVGLGLGMKPQSRTWKGATRQCAPPPTAFTRPLGPLPIPKAFQLARCRSSEALSAHAIQCSPHETSLD